MQQIIIAKRYEKIATLFQPKAAEVKGRFLDQARSPKGVSKAVKLLK